MSGISSVCSVFMVFILAVQKKCVCRWSPEVVACGLRSGLGSQVGSDLRSILHDSWWEWLNEKWTNNWFTDSPGVILAFFLVQCCPCRFFLGGMSSKVCEENMVNSTSFVVSDQQDLPQVFTEDVWNNTFGTLTIQSPPKNGNET